MGGGGIKKKKKKEMPWTAGSRTYISHGSIGVVD